MMALIPSRYFSPLYGVSDTEGFDTYIREWQGDIAELLGPMFNGFPSGPPPFSYYLTVPAAGPYADFVFTIAQHIDAVVQTVDAYLSLGGGLIALARRRKEREAPYRDEAANWDRRPYLYSGLRGIEAMCLFHAHQNYYDASIQPQIEVQSSTRGEPRGSARIPAPIVQYTIDITIGHAHYIYVMRADGRPVEHFVLKGETMEGLDVPDWFEERVGLEVAGKPEKARQFLHSE